MEKKYISKLKIVNILIVLFFLIGTAIVALYPFNNRDIRFEIITNNKETFVFEKTAVEILNEEEIDFYFEELDSILIDQIKIYGNFKSMHLKKIFNYELPNYVEEITAGIMQWEEEGLMFFSQPGMQVRMNDTFQKEIQQLSASFLEERIIIVGALFIVCAFMILVCTIFEEKKSKSNHGPVYETKKFISDIRKYGQYMVYAAQTDLRAEVANSYLNRLWWLLEPFFSMLVYVLVFGQLMGGSIENYPTFIFSTLLMWNFFNKTINYSVKLVRNNKEIISKVYIPKFILLLSNMVLNLFKLFFSAIILVIMMIIFRIEVGFNIIWIIPAYMGIILFSFGIGMIFLHFGVYIDDLAYAVGILLNILVYLSGIFYEIMDTLPEPLNMLMMCLNPVAMYADTMRNALLYNSVTNLPVLIIWFIISVILCCIGVHIVYKNENGYVKVV